MTKEMKTLIKLPGIPFCVSSNMIYIYKKVTKLPFVTAVNSCKKNKKK